MEEEKLVPKRRFEGFKAEWQEVHLSAVANIIGGSTPITSKEEYWNGEIDWYTPTEIGKEVYATESEKRITELGLRKCSATILPANKTILFTSRAGIGDMAILVKDGATNQGFQSLVLKDNFDIYFIYSIGYKIKEYALINSSGSTFLEVSGKTLEKMKINLPFYKEQQKIGAFFKVLDERIANQERKIAKVKALKAAYLTEMFPKEGETVPKRRFKGFEGEWKLKTLNSICPDISDGDWIENEHISNSGKYRIIQTGNLGHGKFLNRESFSKYISRDSFKILNANEIFPGDILISRLAEPAGRTIIIPNINKRMVTAVDVAIIRNSNHFDGYFLVTQMNSKSVLSKINENVSGTSHKRISRKNLEKTLLIIPRNIKEQQKIGEFFKNLDNQIEMEEKKLDKLKKTKEAYLEEMFV